MYFADFSAVRKLGRAITGAEYQRLRFGPAPRRLTPVRQALVRNDDARLEERVDALGYVRHELIPLREASLTPTSLRPTSFAWSTRSSRCQAT
ncbi:MAG: type II toxin-antitoxin system antitoxin SocA domain-containing protein [Acidimicrobiales bacterium]